jgi:ABC-type sugar transport system permease subunit
MSSMLSPGPANAAAGIIARKQPDIGAGRPRRSKWVARSKLYLALIALMAPMLGGMALFTYYPQYSTIKYSFYKWDGGSLFEEFRGLENYRRAFTGDTLFWPTFGLVLILLAANIVKMWPSIFAAIVVHRLKSERWQYIYRVLFVVPMVIPSLVGLLIWKGFYDPLIGPLNQFLNATGLMRILAWLDVRMPALSAALAPVLHRTVDPLFYSVGGMLMTGVLLFCAAGGWAAIKRAWLFWLLAVALAASVMGVGDALAAAYWPAEGTAPTDLHWSVVVRFAIWVLGAAFAGEWSLRTRGVAGTRIMRWSGAVVAGVACLAAAAAMLWTSPVGQFDTGTPGWLSNSKLIVPSLILWGFPWVGTVGVLLYLAGLQNISQDIYEAADIDGVGSVGKLFYIELPLILVQVRINLIFLTIGTLTDYGLFLLLLGAQGGPGGVGVVPGLYMYRKAFVDGEFGYACALGIVLAAIILIITVLYQKYVTVEK